MKRLLLALALAGAPIVYAAPAHAQYVLNLREADIRAFIQDAARVTGRTFIIDPQVQGRVSVVTERPLSRSEYFELFLSTLRANGYVAVPTGRGALRVQPISGAASSAPVGRSARRSGSSFVTEIVRVRSIEPAQAIETLRPLVSRDGSITASRNSIVVSDFADNVRRVRQVLGEIDVSAAVVDRTTTRVIGVENIGPRELAQALTALAPEGVSVVPIDSANSIALRGDAPTLARLAAVATELDQRAARGADVRVVFLQHADAAQLLPVLQTLLGQTPSYTQPLQNTRFANTASQNTNAPGSPAGAQTPRPLNTTVQTGPTPGGGGAAPQGELPPAYRNAVVTRFEGANAIVISATQDVQRMMSEVVRQLDVRREQVLVEAIIVEISDQAAQQLGVRLFLAGLNGSAVPFGLTNYSNLNPGLGTIGGLAAGLVPRTDTNGDGRVDGSDRVVPTDQQIGTAAGILNGVSGGLAGLGFRAGDAIFGSILNAVRSDNRSNILSTPSIMTLDNQEARILVGQEIPITTGEALSPNFDNAFRTVQRQNVGVTLQVRPQINAGGTIKMDLRVEVSSIAGPVSASFQDLILNKREIENTITIDEGEIVGIGGLLDDNERRTIERIPLLGDIPVIGNLFRSRGRARNKTNLMIFIRPTILRSAADARAVAARRYDYVRDQQLSINPEREPTIDELVRDYMGTVPPNAPAEVQPTDVLVDPTQLPGIGGPAAPVEAPPAAQTEVPLPTDAQRPQGSPR